MFSTFFANPWILKVFILGKPVALLIPQVLDKASFGAGLECFLPDVDTKNTSERGWVCVEIEDLPHHLMIFNDPPFRQTHVLLQV